jgi:hypothetical protein
LSHADYNALGEVPVSETANEVTEARNKGLWWKNFISQREPLLSVYRPQNSVKVVR